jgi:DNA-binding MarR family transcriptional regulator
LTASPEKFIILAHLVFYVFLVFFGKPDGAMEGYMKLTRRQESFIRKLLDLYHEAETPIHYSDLAEHIGVSKITAYDMLRTLEEKGYITSHYQLEDEKTGPGRSRVVFSPSEYAHTMVAQMAGPLDEMDWEQVKEKVISALSPGMFPDKELRRDLFDRLSEEENEDIRYCLEVMTILILRMKDAEKFDFFMETLPQILPETGTSKRSSLILIGGFTLGLLADESAKDQVWGQELIDHVKQVQRLVAEMNDDSCNHLASSILEISNSLKD